MSENTDYQSPEINEEEEIEPSFSDKMVGVFTEPGKIFGEIAKFRPKTTDWLVPLLLFILLAIISNVVMMSNPEIKYSVNQMQQERIQEMVEEGQLTQEMADKQIEQMEKFSDGPLALIFSSIGTIIVVFIVFFIVAGVFHLVSKFALGGEGSFVSSMIGYGLPYYIVALQAIVTVILALVLGKLVTGTSVAVFTDLEKGSLLRFVLTKLDIFSIWFYAVVSIGFAKMHRAESYGKYFAMVFGLWLGFSFIMFFLGQAFPFLKNFVM